MSIKATSSEYKALLRKFYEKIKAENLSYSDKSPVIEGTYLNLLETNELKQAYIQILRATLQNIISYK
jgi:hypothetical protein